MSTAFRHFNVRFERAQWDRLVALGEERNQATAEIIRAAVDVYLGAASTTTQRQRRLARLSEFVQIAVDILIREQYPEYRDRIIAEADKRLEQYHGA